GARGHPVAEGDPEQGEGDAGREQRGGEAGPARQRQGDGRRGHGDDRDEGRGRERERGGGEQTGGEPGADADRQRPQVELPRRGALDGDADPELEERDPERGEAGEGRHPRIRALGRGRGGEEEEEDRREGERRHDEGRVADELERQRAGVQQREPHRRLRAASASASVSGRTSRPSSTTPARTSSATAAPASATSSRTVLPPDR